MTYSTNGGAGEASVKTARVLKNRKEIRHILVDELGFRDLEAYRRWVQEVRTTISITPSLIEKLSPDVVDCRAFWRVCDELFGSDPICNVAVDPSVGKLPYEINTQIDANRMNLRLAKSVGITAFLEENANARLSVLEIGPGYGSLKNFIESHTNHVYMGVDVVPRIPGVLEATVDGLLPRELIEQYRASLSYVVATNVFQHFSARQHTQYVEDAHALLQDGGLFIFNLTIDTGKLPAYMRDQDGSAWAVHYGQYTPIPTASSVYAELARTFDILYVTQRYDGLFNFICQKRPHARIATSGS